MTEKQYLAHVREDKNGVKIRHTVYEHLTGTGKLASEFASKIGMSDAGMVMGILHDFGKYSSEFQQYIHSATGMVDGDNEEWVDSDMLKGKIDHSTAGAQYVWEYMKDIRSEDNAGMMASQILGLCIASHHSGLIDCLEVDGNFRFIERMDKPDKKTHLMESMKNVEPELKNKIESFMNLNTVNQVISGVDRIIESEGGMNIPVMFNIGMLTKFLFSCLIDGDRLDTIEFMKSSDRFSMSEQRERRWNRFHKNGWDVFLKRFNKRIMEFGREREIDRLRWEISDECKKRASDKKGIFTLSVPTGGGKTLSSLRFAMEHAHKHDMDRIIYVIPYTSIIEQNADVARKYLGEECVLEHHCNLIYGDDNWKNKTLTENWDAPVVFTTMVQFLNTLFSGGTRNIRRMHNMSNSVLIFDEIQNIPIKCVHMFCNAINWLSEHAGSSAVMCTATQPLLDRLPNTDYGSLRLSENHELCPDRDDKFVRLKRVDINNECRPGGWSENEIVGRIRQRFNNHGNCLVIVNTKRWARNLYRSLSRHVRNDVLYHLSTGMCPAHRKDILKIIKERLKDEKPVICISTQLIEAGVDIDFRSVIRFMAGMDSINQAAGRCNREGRMDEMGIVDVINPDEEPLHRLPDIRIGVEVSDDIFDEFGETDMLSPKIMDKFYEYFFWKRRNLMGYPLKNEAATSMTDILSNNLICYGDIVGENEYPLLMQSFMRAGKEFRVIDNMTKDALVYYGEKGTNLVEELSSISLENKHIYQLKKEAQQYSIGVFDKDWKKLENINAVHEVQEGFGIYYIDPEYYSNEFGLSIDSPDEAKFLNP